LRAQQEVFVIHQHFVEDKSMRSTITVVVCSVVGFCMIALNQVSAQTVSPHDYNPAIWGGKTVTTSTTPTGTGLSKMMLPVIIPAAATIPTIDGIVNTSEWADALAINGVQVTSSGNVVYLKNDACYLYFGGIIDNSGASATGNCAMINVWFDLNQNGTWDNLPTGIDGNLAFSMPTSTTNASFGHPGLGGDWALSSGRLRYHRPWYSAGVTVPTSQIFLARTQQGTLTHVEAKIDLANSPLKMQGGVPVNMRIQWYCGNTSTVTIMAQWPTVNTTAYFTGPLATELTDIQTTPVTSATTFDVGDFEFTGSTAINPGGNAIASAVYTLVAAPPQTMNYVAKVYGPYPNLSTPLTTIAGSVQLTQATGTAQIVVPMNYNPGYYPVEVIIEVPGPCGPTYKTIKTNFLVIPAGSVPCYVWPGDINNDGLVNYSDRKTLNKYIYDANLDPTWINGPGRLPPHYPAALSEVEWMEQPAIPWITPDGCYMDADGNGVVNNFDYVAVKVNWMHSHSVIKPDPVAAEPASFDLRQNFPNPFNPNTKIGYNVPEQSHVYLTIVDLSGRMIETLVDRVVEAGSYEVDFIAPSLASGQYIATVVIKGERTGSVFTRSIKMTLSK
jgi:hypothetical protein